jgi:hypothetical protein
MVDLEEKLEDLIIAIGRMQVALEEKLRALSPEDRKHHLASLEDAIGRMDVAGPPHEYESALLELLIERDTLVALMMAQT